MMKMMKVIIVKMNMFCLISLKERIIILRVLKIVFLRKDILSIEQPKMEIVYLDQLLIKFTEMKSYKILLEIYVWNIWKERGIIILSLSLKIFLIILHEKKKDRDFGNHLELQAICELYNRPVEIFVANENPINLFHEIYKTDNAPIRLSYHSGNHYNSVRDPKNPTVGVGLGIPNFKKGSVDNALVNQAIEESENNFYEEKILEESIKESENMIIDKELEEREKKQLEETIRKSEDMILDDTLMDQTLYESELDQTSDLFMQAILLESMQNF